MDFLNQKTIFLAAGMQSGGTTVISNCFLRHPELNGVLDMSTDNLQVSFSRVQSDRIWVKMTISSFRCEEVIKVYENYGYKVVPLLIVRNPFDVWASLKTKWYGLNSVTAEDPPLFLRFTRFLEDWEFFKRNNLPVLCFEDFKRSPESVLKESCDYFELQFSQHMLREGSTLDEIAYVAETNESFSQNLTRGLTASVADTARSLTQPEYDWISENISELITKYGYINRHSILNDTDSFLPDPINNRRMLGWGRNAAEWKLSNSMLKMVSSAKSAQQRGLSVWIFGSNLFGEQVYNTLRETAVTVSGFFDNHSDSNHRIATKRIYHPSVIKEDPNLFIVIASIKNSVILREQLVSNYGVDDNNIFQFEKPE